MTKAENKGMNYFDAYKQRVNGIDQLMKNYAIKFKDLGCEVYAPKNKLIRFIAIVKDNKHCFFGFSEVPYRFYIHIEIPIITGQGNGKTILEVDGTETDWPPEFIMSNMSDNPPRLNLSYLTQI